MKKQYQSNFKIYIKYNKFHYLQNKIKCEHFSSSNKKLYMYNEKKYFIRCENRNYNVNFVHKNNVNLPKIYDFIRSQKKYRKNVPVFTNNNYNLNNLENVKDNLKMIQKYNYCVNMNSKRKKKGDCANNIKEIIKSNIKSYIILSRLHIPDGVYLLFYSALYGYFLTYNVDNLLINNELNIKEINEIFKNIGLFLFGSINSRIVGCIINDFFDKNFDRYVERTKNRPLANNTISTKKALAYFCIHGSLALLTLFQFNYQTICIGLFSTFFITTYPLLKRITYYAQIYLSFTFNLGFLIASSVNLDVISNIIPLFISFLPLSLLTIIYDTIYAHQDKKDDLKLNLKSLAIKWDQKTLKNSKFLAFNMLYLFYLTGYLFNIHYTYYILSTFNILYLYYNLNQSSLNDKEKCMKFFKKSKHILLLIAFSALFAKSCELWEKGKNKKINNKETQNEVKKTDL
ncbi:para-hydroxybenzoate--polyprenyltransferase, putative [Plasmodium gallinaceum]|uniref:Para-hydroxybenzoate--polyprenyltransferase, putative n=1 Tax=Plasmodium gallinaceum TaxID=5849 RepID=A0A1J1GQU4_PLAGA|nr:para-hydroxybenzoate--polyprenyltransferase, putative [Plasmodium gallinaceum]CRG93655.1 para-hydroxybenzoate--polyprenyltransferase, putative [Plasmodium gallinaceum]